MKEFMSYREVNFDGLVGPTHNYAGLSEGNRASTANREAVAHPRAAALQGLLKALSLAKRGFPQAILPPHERPSVAALRAWGIPGESDEDVITKSARLAPELLAAAASASAMWTANALTMAPSCDTRDGKVHLTPANLSSKLHRSMEASFTERLLRTIFANEERFVVHPPLAGGDAMADEGAANHTRLCINAGQPGLHLFVYGRSAIQPAMARPRKFPARQTLESVQALTRNHQIPHHQFALLQQNPEAIDAGVFHNDVIAVGSRNILLVHEDAFVDFEKSLSRVVERFVNLTSAHLHTLVIRRKEVSLEDAVQTYLFNSQILTSGERAPLLVVPSECMESTAVSAVLEEIKSSAANPIQEVLSFNLRESMRNGGGPACLRNRIVLSEEELPELKGRLFLDEPLHADLVDWVEKHYRENLAPDDLRDPLLLEESRTALDELTGILQLPSNLYPFQQ